MGLSGKTPVSADTVECVSDAKTCLFNDDVICEYYTVFMVGELNVIMEICC
jgi:hypothetical protein